MMFTVEEMAGIAAFDTSSRERAIADINAITVTMKNSGMDEPMVYEFCEQILKKLIEMSDEEFAAVDFTLYEEEFYDEYGE